MDTEETPTLKEMITPKASENPLSMSITNSETGKELLSQRSPIVQRPNLAQPKVRRNRDMRQGPSKVANYMKRPITNLYSRVRATRNN